MRHTVVDEVARARVVEKSGCKLRAMMQGRVITCVLAFLGASGVLEEAAILALVESVWSVSQPQSVLLTAV